MIEKLSKILAVFMKRSGSDLSEEVLIYAFSNILNIVMVSTTSLIIGAVSGSFIETLIALIAFATIRRFSGGIHMRSMDQCYVVSTLIIVIPPHIVLAANTVSVLTIIGLIIYILFAPNITEDLSSSKNNKLRNKIVSLVLVGSNLYLHSSTLALIYLMQALMIIPYNSKKGGA